MSLKKFRWISFLILLFSLVIPTQAQSQESLSESQIEQIAKSVVLIEATKGKDGGQGSGVFITADGVIATNKHVVQVKGTTKGVTYKIYMAVDYRQEPVFIGNATIRSVAKKTDFATLQMEKSDTTYTPIPVATDYLTLGSRINIFGFPSISNGSLTLTFGHISAIDGERWYYTDAEISPGNSGGLAVNQKGEMIGIPTQVTSDDRTYGRLGKLIPIIKPRLEALAKDGTSNASIGRDSKQPPAPLSIRILKVMEDTTVEGSKQKGIIVYAKITAKGYRGKVLKTGVYFDWVSSNGKYTPVKAGKVLERDHKDSKGYLTASTELKAISNDEVWHMVKFFICYCEFQSMKKGDYRVRVWSFVHAVSKPDEAMQSNFVNFDISYN